MIRFEVRSCGLANQKRDTPDRGDDATVLDWQCYWLREYGVQGVVLFGGTAADGIADNSSSPGYWCATRPNALF